MREKRYDKDMKGTQEREIFTKSYYWIVGTGESEKNYEEEVRTSNFYCPVMEEVGGKSGIVIGKVPEKEKDFLDERSILEKAEEYNLVVGWD